MHFGGKEKVEEQEERKEGDKEEDRFEGSEKTYSAFS